VIVALFGFAIEEECSLWLRLLRLPELPGRILPVTSVLRIARLDAEHAYRDLAPYRISIALERDGWHIDYQFKDPNLNGGGPHYVIDPSTGAILSKVYEQ